MITPTFKILQTESAVQIKVSAPHCNVKELEVIVIENEFLFSCEPYLLRLILPGNLKDINPKHEYDDFSEFTFTYLKEVPGQDFLSSPTKMKSYNEPTDAHKAIEEVFKKLNLQENDEETKAHYGFALAGKNLKDIYDEVGALFEINPFNVPFEDRKNVRTLSENKKFDIDHYLADFTEREEIEEIIKMTSPWDMQVHKSAYTLTANELHFLTTIPSNNLKLTDSQIKYSNYSLLDILFAYFYDRRTTHFEGTCESGWTILKISASLSCFDSFTSSKEALISAFRRSIIYPLYRDFELCERVFEDLKIVFSLGKNYIIKCLIDMYNVFDEGSDRYILNDLYIRNYIKYVAGLSESAWNQLSDDILNVHINKTELGLDLLNVEKLVLNEIRMFKVVSNASGSSDSESDSDVQSTESDSETTESDSNFDSTDNDD